MSTPDVPAQDGLSDYPPPQPQPDFTVDLMGAPPAPLPHEHEREHAQPHTHTHEHTHEPIHADPHAHTPQQHQHAPPREDENGHAYAAHAQLKLDHGASAYAHAPTHREHEQTAGEKRRRDDADLYAHDPALVPRVVDDGMGVVVPSGAQVGIDMGEDGSATAGHVASRYPDLDMERGKRTRVDEGGPVPMQAHEQIPMAQQGHEGIPQGHEMGGAVTPPGDESRGKRRINGPAFSHAIRTRQQGYTRTGQACDRCKTRKIKCDALPEGCSACATARVDCFVTDRVSGRTERRGYLQEVERERERMVHYIRDLERIVAEGTSIELRPSPWTATVPGPALAGEGWEQVGSVVVRGFRPRDQGSGEFTGLHGPEQAGV